MQVSQPLRDFVRPIFKGEADWRILQAFNQKERESDLSTLSLPSSRHGPRAITCSRVRTWLFLVSRANLTITRDNTTGPLWPRLLINMYMR